MINDNQEIFDRYISAYSIVIGSPKEVSRNPYTIYLNSNSCYSGGYLGDPIVKQEEYVPHALQFIDHKRIMTIKFPIIQMIKDAPDNFILSTLENEFYTIKESMVIHEELYELHNPYFYGVPMNTYIFGMGREILRLAILHVYDSLPISTDQHFMDSQGFNSIPSAYLQDMITEFRQGDHTHVKDFLVGIRREQLIHERLLLIYKEEERKNNGYRQAPRRTQQNDETSFSKTLLNFLQTFAHYIHDSYDVYTILNKMSQNNETILSKNIFNIVPYMRTEDLSKYLNTKNIVFNEVEIISHGNVKTTSNNNFLQNKFKNYYYMAWIESSSKNKNYHYLEKFDDNISFREWLGNIKHQIVEDLDEDNFIDYMKSSNSFVLFLNHLTKFMDIRSCYDHDVFSWRILQSIYDYKITFEQFQDVIKVLDDFFVAGSKNLSILDGYSIFALDWYKKLYDDHGVNVPSMGLSTNNYKIETNTKDLNTHPISLYYEDFEKDIKNFVIQTVLFIIDMVFHDVSQGLPASWALEKNIHECTFNIKSNRLSLLHHDVPEMLKEAYLYELGKYGFLGEFLNLGYKLTYDGVEVTMDYLTKNNMQKEYSNIF